MAWHIGKAVCERHSDCEGDSACGRVGPTVKASLKGYLKTAKRQGRNKEKVSVSENNLQHGCI